MPLDIVHLRFYSEFQWLLDFSVAAAATYLLSESSQLFFKIKDEFNLSMVWCLLVIGFTTYPFIRIKFPYEYLKK